MGAFRVMGGHAILTLGHLGSQSVGVGAVARISILDLRLTDHAASALDERGILPEDLYAIIAGFYVVTRNRRGRAASNVLIGYDPHGRCLAAPIVPTDHSGVWRVITVWPCKSSEADMLR